MKVGITGSKGFIGSYLTKALLNSGYTISEWDLKDGRDIKDFSVSGLDYVVHLAAYANVRQSIKDPQKYWINNVEYTTEIQKQCHYNQVPLLYASSSCIHRWWLSPYGTTKKVNEETAFPNQVALRFTTVYGDGARDTMLIPKLLDGSVTYLTNHIRDFVHVDDVIDAILILMRQDIRLKRAYDIGTGTGVLVSDLGPIAGYSDLTIKDGDPCEALDNTADNSSMKDLGWEPKYDVEKYVHVKTSGENI